MFENAYWLIALSVLMHVVWNLLARHADPKANYLWWGLLAHLIILAPYSIWQLVKNAEWNLELTLALTASGLANSLYFVALRRAYYYAPVSLVYPVARSSPLLIAFWSWLLFSEVLSLEEFVAIIISVAGLWFLAASTKQGDARHALPWAGIAAFGTSVYSISDKVAVEYLPGFTEQLGYISVGYACSFVALTIIQKKESGSWRPQVRPHWSLILIGGLCIGTAYALVVRAMRELPAAHVVSFTNGGIVLAVLLSIIMFKEREHWKMRILGSLVVSAGLILLVFNS
ncbi:MAG: phosphonate utilization associated putative membrane protein [Oleiphilaceae bacterium]|jgi:phosphonate utilization associated putative membrane protein